MIAADLHSEVNPERRRIRLEVTWQIESARAMCCCKRPCDDGGARVHSTM